MANDSSVVNPLEGNKAYKMRLVDELNNGLIVQNYGYYLTLLGGGGGGGYMGEEDVLKCG